MLSWRGRDLWIEDVRAVDLARRFGTPLYVYSLSTIRKRFEELKKELLSFGDGLICFSVKALNVLAILKDIADMGGGADVVSAGELYIALKAGFPKDKIVFAGVGKTKDEIKFANGKIFMLNIESESEYEIVKRLNPEFIISFRVKFGIAENTTHEYLSVGGKDTKFGMLPEVALKLYEDAKRSRLKAEGIHFHIGSQIFNMEEIFLTAKKVREFIDELRKRGIEIKYVDCGGGLGISYEGKESPKFSDWIKSLSPLKGFKIILEPGRSIAAPAGFIISRVIRKKRSGEKNFLIIDAGMTEVIRPPLYGSQHRVLPCRLGRNESEYFVVGPICENSDFINESVKMDVDEGDFVCILDAGAYCTTQGSTYNGRPRPAEVVVYGRKAFLVRPREKFQDLIKRDRIIPKEKLEKIKKLKKE